MVERTKTFEIEGCRFQVSKVNALDGSNILRKFSRSGIGDPREFIANASDEEFKSLQSILLNKVSEIQIINGVEVNIPVILSSGEVVGRAAEDASLVFGLTAIAFMFNLSDFLAGSALTGCQAVMESFNAPKP